MTSSEVRKKYLDFFEKRGHKIVPSSSLVPENDPTTLFTSAGMQPMVPYLLGEPHPEGKRITDSQKVFRAVDIEAVGDRWHGTIFEMIGNWSFGDYWKKEQLEWIWQFLTEEVGIDPQNLYITTFIGDQANNLPKDEESVEIWKGLFLKKGIEAKVVGIGSVKEGSQHGKQDGRIFYYDAKKNWWSRSGGPQDMPPGEPGGPSSEMFYEFTEVEHDSKFGPQCHPNCNCGRFIEMGNSVFMQYIKQADGTFKELPHKNVDFGGGLERITAVANKLPDVFQTDAFWPIIEKLQEQLGVIYEDNPEVTKNFRIIADHIKAATFLIKDGVLPSNKLQGYVLRRLLRRAAVKINQLTENSMGVLPKLVDPVLDIYKDTDYFQQGDWNEIRPVIENEISKFKEGLVKGEKFFRQIENKAGWLHTAKGAAEVAFDLYQNYGYPIEVFIERLKHTDIRVNYSWQNDKLVLEGFQKLKEKHAELSRTTSAGMFKGGLADQAEATTKLHTATHLIQAAAKQILGKDVGQRGSHITAERLRWDFNYNQKLTADQIRQIEDLVNENIKRDLKVWFDIENRDEAIKNGATTNHGESYPDKVKVYKIAEFSKELCGGPHVEHTGTLGKFKILKEEGISTGIRRIYATIEN